MHTSITSHKWRMAAIQLLLHLGCTITPGRLFGNCNVCPACFNYILHCLTSVQDLCDIKRAERRMQKPHAARELDLVSTTTGRLGITAQIGLITAAENGHLKTTHSLLKFSLYVLQVFVEGDKAAVGILTCMLGIAIGWARRADVCCWLILPILPISD